MKAVFIDRDGVLVESIHGDYIRSIDQIKLIAKAVDALHILKDAGYKIVIVTNQALVGKGILTLNAALAIQQTVIEMLDPAGELDISYELCPHLVSDNCECRKPKPGMLQNAKRKFDIDFASSFLIGDARSDVEAARAVGVEPVMVLTGRGENESVGLDASVTVRNSIYEAAQEIVK